MDPVLIFFPSLLFSSSVVLLSIPVWARHHGTCWGLCSRASASDALPGWDIEHETKSWTGVCWPPMPSAVAGFATVSVKELPSFESDDDPNHNPAVPSNVPYGRNATALGKQSGARRAHALRRMQQDGFSVESIHSREHRAQGTEQTAYSARSQGLHSACNIGRTRCVATGPPRPRFHVRIRRSQTDLHLSMRACTSTLASLYPRHASSWKHGPTTRGARQDRPQLSLLSAPMVARSQIYWVYQVLAAHPLIVHTIRMYTIWGTTLVEVASMTPNVQRGMDTTRVFGTVTASQRHFPTAEREKTTLGTK